MSGDTWRAMWVTHDKPCVTMHGKGMHVSTCMAPLKDIKGEFQFSLWGAASFSSWEQQGEGGGREKRKGGKERSKGGKERRKERRKEKKKGEEERKKKEEKEGVLRSKQTRTAKNPKLRCKR